MSSFQEKLNSIIALITSVAPILATLAFIVAFAFWMFGSEEGKAKAKYAMIGSVGIGIASQLADFLVK